MIKLKLKVNTANLYLVFIMGAATMLFAYLFWEINEKLLAIIITVILEVATLYIFRNFTFEREK